MKLETVIGDLLLRHNCVIVPEFGGFVAQQTSASIDVQQGLLYPPNKSILFNKHLQTNDGLIISAFSTSHSFSYDESLQYIKKSVAEWKKQLLRGERIYIDRVGFLFIDSSKNISFRQDTQFNLLLSSYGLSCVKFQPHVAHIGAISSEKSQRALLPFTYSNESGLDISPRIKNTGVWKHIVAACVIPIVFYTFWIPLKTDVLESKILSFNDLNPFHKHSTAQYQPKEHSTIFPSLNISSFELNEAIQLVETNEHTYSYKLREDTYILVNINCDTQQELNDKAHTNHSEDVLASKKNVSSQKQNKNIHYIVGCFSQEVNAQKLISELSTRGVEAFIYDKKGSLYRVSAGQSHSLKDAQHLAIRMKTLGYSGWILKDKNYKR